MRVSFRTAILQKFNILPLESGIVTSFLSYSTILNTTVIALSENIN